MRILFVDDSDLVRITLCAILDDAGHTVVEADSLASARTRLAGASFELVLLDIHLGDGLGPTLIPELRAALPGVIIAMFTGDPQPVEGADVVFSKGSSASALLNYIEAYAPAE